MDADFPVDSVMEADLAKLEVYGTIGGNYVHNNGATTVASIGNKTVQAILGGTRTDTTAAEEIKQLAKKALYDLEVSDDNNTNVR